MSIIRGFLPALLSILLLGLSPASAGRKLKSSDCSAVKDSFLPGKPAIASTILSTPQHDAGLELCTFTNHTENKRPSCCSHNSEKELLLSAPLEYKEILHQHTNEVINQLGPEENLRNHFTRMMSISKRMTEYEIGKTLNLHHIDGRNIFTDFFSALENILLSHNTSVSIFKATDTLLDRLFVYVIREATTPGSRDEPTVAYTDCVQKHRRSITPTPFPEQALRQATSVHYSAIASSYLAVAMDLTFKTLNYTRDFLPMEACMRDLVKLNHCQKCYGYADMRPCRYFCEDVFLVCMHSLVWLDTSWEFHMKITKILSEYILKRVNLHTLLNDYHIELKSSVEKAILDYPKYKTKLAQYCGDPAVETIRSRSHGKAWTKPLTTSYEGDFSGDLQKLVVNLELKAQGFYANLHTSICANEPTIGTNCWDGLTERENKKKMILDFKDQFSRYPDQLPEVNATVESIERIREEVLRIFLKSDKQDSDDELGSGSGDDEISPGGGGPDDEDSGKPTLLGASRTVAPLRTQSHSKNKAANTVTDSAKPLTYRSDDTDADNSIELVEEQVTAKVSSIKDGVTSSSDILKPSIISANILLVSLYMISSVLKV